MFEIPDDEKTPTYTDRLVLAVGCSTARARQWQQDAEHAGLQLRVVPLEGVRLMSKSFRPRAVIITEEVFAFDPGGFLQMADDIGGTVVRVTSRQSSVLAELLSLPGASRARAQSGIRRRVAHSEAPSAGEYAWTARRRRAS